MSPGFAYPDYQTADRAEMLQQYPDFTAMVERLTREAG
jgi:hypothetical protein